MIGTFKLPQTETYVDRVAHRFILRVITDSGVTYDEPNLKAILTDLNNDSLLSSASLVLAPSSYKATKLYSALPESGVGDFTVSRNSIATRVNKSGLIETVGVNVPRIDYSDGTPSLLVEPQSTNLLTYSEDFSNASWSKTRFVTPG